ncbi:MAG: hypothetical protein QOI46_2293, partial [Alphaproteobacteria bacterium]|nr:hypothetical protein [Alphaproteobacteria bacterium]
LWNAWILLLNGYWYGLQDMKR